LPVVSRVIETSEQAPCLAIAFKLEMPVVRELLSREEIEVAEAVLPPATVGNPAVTYPGGIV
jgi:AraC-type transcriptional regulator N-terminus